MLSSARRSELSSTRRLLAENYAAELMETFQSQKGSDILNYLATNPFNAGLSPYFLCAHINLLDRAHSTSANASLLNPDPNADLPFSQLGSSSANFSGNRYYLVQVMDVSVDPPVVKSQYCNKAATTYAPGAATERLMVSVGVTWVEPKGNPSQPSKVILSGVIPQW